MNLHILLLFLLHLHLAHSKSLIDSISNYTQLTNFTYLLKSQPRLAQLFLNSSYTVPQTILIPNNEAFTRYQADHGYAIDALDSHIIEWFIQYHTLNGSLNSTTLLNSARIVISSQLVDQDYDNRGMASNVDTPGQVMCLSPWTNSTFITANGGLGSTGLVDLVDGKCDSGLFHIIDRILALPVNCTDTMSVSNLTSMNVALNRSDNVDEWNSQAGVTCLAPTNSAFLTAGNLSYTADPDSLEYILEAHTIHSAQYTPYLHDGQTLISQANTSIRVSIRDGVVYFNDAKALKVDVLTNNGVIHVLDKASFLFERGKVSVGEDGAD